MSKHQREQSELETQVNEVMIQGEQFIEKHLKKVLIAVAAVVLIVVGIFAYIKFVREPRAMQASVASYVAEDHFLRYQDSLALSGIGIEHKGFEALAKEYSGTDAANLAHAYSAIAHYDAGKYDAAIEDLKHFSGKDQFVAPSLKRLLGDCYAQLGKYEEAVAAYLEAAKMANNEAVTPSCLIKAARAYEKLGKTDKAKEVYLSLQKDYAASVEAQSLEADLLRVGA
ncbi:MAG: tetratricopeptide repeat protein [Porphyromonadaceae bacterium]|nr:tetratricopeptide repeat protein [Porphyromonadaceae bacterium]